jgi:DNA-binding response OmpR family regulator
MHVLIVDDDRSTRYLIGRTLSKRFGCQVTEAGDGRQALEALAGAPFRLACLDVQMPVMDGLETLRNLRDSPEHSSLPVVMLTGERDETIIREILELGVLEYLGKPLNMARLNDRVRRILRAIGVRRSGAPAEAGWLGAAVTNTAAPLLIVDGRTPFRRLFVEAFGSRRPVIEAETGVAGMRDIATANPGAVFIGTDLGVLNDALLVKKIRSMPSLAALPLVALVDDEEEGDGRMVHYDGVLTRTLAHDTLVRRMSDLIRLGAPSGWEAPGLPPGFRATVLLVSEQVFGTALAADLAVCDLPFVAPIDRVTVRGRVDLPTGAVSIEVMCDLNTARRAATNLFGVDARMVTDANAAPAVAKVFELFRARLSGVYGTDDGATPEAPVTARTDKWTPSLDLEHVTLCFQTPAKDHEFFLVLSPVRT